jgi:tetratricopeptide (TPR) repeat protein
MMSLMDTDFATALQLHLSGQQAEAARHYQLLLDRQPDHADALHMFGLLHHQIGFHTKSIELMSRAASLRPDMAGYRANLAEAFRALGRHEQAIEFCRAALRLQWHFPVALNNLGLAWQGKRQDEEAVRQFRSALAQRPGFAQAENNLGISLRRLNQVGEAMEAFRAAVALAPQWSVARTNLGRLLVEIGRVEEGLVHCREAVRLEPGSASAHEELGKALRAAGNTAEADASRAVAKRLATELALRHAARGQALLREGYRADAFVCFRQAVELAPDDADMWQHLANAHVADEDYAAAILCCERSVALDPKRATMHSNLGTLLDDAGQRAEAAECFRRALEIEPGHVEALVNQGGLYEELGEMAQAEACYRRARSADPLACVPLARLATMLRDRFPEESLHSMNEMLQSPRLSTASRSALLFGLAHVLDARAAYDEAADCLVRANALAVELRRDKGQLYDPEEQARYIDRVTEHYTQELFVRLEGAGDDTRQPVFVFGLPRSGTTLVEQMLASHSRVHGAGELRLAREVCEGVPALVGQENDMKACLGALDGPVLRELGRRYRNGVHGLVQRDRPGTDPERIVDKMPDNYLYLGMLALMFPRAAFIHVRRDIRDVAVSCWMTNFRSIRWASDMDHLASRFRDHRRIMAHWRQVLRVPVHEVVYEELVDDFEEQARRLIDACGLKWEPACLRFHESKRPVRTASVAQVRQPLYRKAVARWKHYETALAELFARLPLD